MVRTKLAAAILGAGMSLPGLAAALGIGDYTLKSYLNQPLELEIELIQTQDLTTEEVIAALASTDDFQRAGVERVFFLSDVRFEVAQRANGRLYVTARSRQPVTEPFLNFLLEVQWPQGRMLREYTILLDPPVYKAGASQVVPAEPVVQAPPASVVAEEPAPAVVQPRPALPPPPSAAVTSGARPADAPKPVAASPAGRDAGAGEYRVAVGDTMWEIAARHRQEGTTVQQTMIAIQRANPGAFIDGNVNLVKRGQVLRIPPAAEVQQVSDGEARRTIADQNRAWRELLDQRGLAVPADRAQLESRKATAGAAAASKPTGAGEVTLVAPAAGAAGAKASGGKDADALRTKLTAAEEELSRAARENKDLASRLADLDKQVKAGDKLMSLKNSEIAELQAELNRLRKEKGLPPLEAPAEQPAVAAEPAAPAEQPAAQDVAKAEKKAEKAEKKKAEKKAAAAEPAPAPAQKGPSMLVPVAGLLALLGIGGGAFWYLRKRKAAAPGTAEAAGDAHDAEVADDLAQLGDLAGGTDDQGSDIFFGGEQAAAGADGEATDPLSEADMYMAYGRFPQAADILYAALQREPERDELRAKLAEVYAEMGDNDAAREQASRIADASDPGIRSQAQAVLARVGGGVAGAAVAAEEELPSLDDLALEFSGGKSAPVAQDDDFALDLADDVPVAAAPAPAVADDLEFSLDDDFSTPVAARPAAAAPAAPAAVEEEEFTLEDADLGDFNLADDIAAAPAPAAEAEEFSLEDDLSLDDADLAVATPDALEELPDLGDDMAVTEVQPAVSDADLELAEAIEAAPAADALDLESELADLDADLSAEGVGETSAGGDDFDFLADSDENATKLDLAKAYIEMGDSEGARDILNEVIADGNDSQKTEARNLLAQVG